MRCLLVLLACLFSLVLTDQDFYCGPVEVTIMYRTIDFYNLDDSVSYSLYVTSDTEEVQVCVPPLTSCGTSVDYGDDVTWVCDSAKACNTTCIKPMYCDYWECAS